MLAGVHRRHFERSAFVCAGNGRGDVIGKSYRRETAYPPGWVGLGAMSLFNELPKAGITRGCVRGTGVSCFYLTVARLSAYSRAAPFIAANLRRLAQYVT